MNDIRRIDVPEGKVAAVVTFMEMRRPPAQRPRPLPEGLSLAQEKLTTRAYRALFREIGGPWLWFSRLALDDHELASIIGDRDVEVHLLRRDEEPLGFFEIDARDRDNVKLAFLGLVREAIGQGFGRLLLERAIARAWHYEPERVIVDSCTLDHPRAIAAYRRAGFTPYARAVEIADDPRLVGLLPRDAATEVAII